LRAVNKFVTDTDRIQILLLLIVNETCTVERLTRLVTLQARVSQTVQAYYYYCYC